MTLELYNSPMSTCSQKVRLCLAEKRLDWVDRRLDYYKNEYTSPDYLKLNPNGVVPTLVHDGQAITDSSVICEYLDEMFPDPSLVPQDPVLRARMRAFMRFAEEVPTPAIRVPSFRIVAPRRFAGMDAETFDRDVASRKPLRKHFFRKMGTAGFSDEDLQIALDQLALTVQRMQGALVEGPWLIGQSYSIADIVVIPTIDRMNDLGLAGIWDSAPRVAEWYDRARERQAYAATYYPGSRLSDTYDFPRPFRVPEIVATGKPGNVPQIIGDFC